MLDEARVAMGRVEEVFGPVALPFYALRWAPGPGGVARPVPPGLRPGALVSSVARLVTHLRPEDLVSYTRCWVARLRPEACLLHSWGCVLVSCP